MSESILGHFLQERESEKEEKRERERERERSGLLGFSLGVVWCGGAFYIRGPCFPCDSEL